MAGTVSTPGTGKPIPISKRWSTDEKYGVKVIKEPAARRAS